jgi:hypothetical protein
MVLVVIRQWNKESGRRAGKRNHPGPIGAIPQPRIGKSIGAVVASEQNGLAALRVVRHSVIQIDIVVSSKQDHVALCRIVGHGETFSPRRAVGGKELQPMFQIQVSARPVFTSSPNKKTCDLAASMELSSS